MSAMSMPQKSWPQLIKAKRQKAIYRITLIVRGREIVKHYTKEHDFRTWLDSFRTQQSRQTDNAIESIKDEVVYR